MERSPARAKAAVLGERDPAVCLRGGGAESLSKIMGYSAEDLEQIPEGADLCLGCGAPLQEARIAKGMTVLDLVSGAGIDVFLAAWLVGENGFAIGVDMTCDIRQEAGRRALIRSVFLCPLMRG